MARRHGFATVCVSPAWVRLSADLLRGSESRVCTVAGFPLGATVPEVKATAKVSVYSEAASVVRSGRQGVRLEARSIVVPMLPRGCEVHRREGGSWRHEREDSQPSP